MLQEVISRISKTRTIEEIWYVAPDRDTVEFCFREGIRLAYETDVLTDYDAQKRLIKLTNGVTISFRTYYNTQLN